MGQAMQRARAKAQIAEQQCARMDRIAAGATRSTTVFFRNDGGVADGLSHACYRDIASHGVAVPG